MPEIIRYTVTQTRSVEVSANNVEDAARIASTAFEKGQDSNGGIAQGEGPTGVWGNTNSRIKVTSLEVRRDR